jgi:protein phosphatase 1 regulatory subunit 37
VSVICRKRYETDGTSRSRKWVEEEGEIFRKGQALLSEKELESEFAGEQLRIEVLLRVNDFLSDLTKNLQLLEAEVERPQPRQFDTQGNQGPGLGVGGEPEDEAVKELNESMRSLASPVELNSPRSPSGRKGATATGGEP